MNTPDETLPDGQYEVVVVDAEIDPEGGARVSLVIVAGTLKGRVVDVRGPAPRDPVDMLAAPGELSVDGGIPTLRLE